MSVNPERYGIILAGGSGTRLGECTKAVSKHLLPVYDKPMIYYPLSVLLELGIRKILLISNPEYIEAYSKLLDDIPGIHIQYAVQDKPRGISEAFIIAESFLGDHPSCLILGDNIFYGPEIKKLKTISRHSWSDHAHILGYQVENPRAYGVAEFFNVDQDGAINTEFSPFDCYKVIRLEEKPQEPRSNYAVPGLYLLPENAPQLARVLCPSKRGELEITDLLSKYIPSGSLSILPMQPTSFWFDAGDPDRLLEVSEFVAAVQKRRGVRVGCPYSVIKN